MALLFVDSHAEFVPYDRLNPTLVVNGKPTYNLDWTAGGLAGEDLR